MRLRDPSAAVVTSGEKGPHFQLLLVSVGLGRVRVTPLKTLSWVLLTLGGLLLSVWR